ncbi:DMT family transporter [Lysinibacillus macroides]|uniref:Antibiotic transporter n=1 Tax=Lysinibacillus macroides TaxID=33935 RepID=A0A0N0CVX2_9BACI|nr:DMT family transporter [Lysinibacillus macroides]KOY82295.1 antibiotic transporter [Lysinibacillus macroides]QPR68119.1 DMT family transporter [Lysinibacillus macroides]
MKIPPYVLLLLATLLWGGNFVIGRAVSDDIPPLTLAFLRWCVAFMVFLPIAYRSLKREWPLLKEHWLIVLILSLTGVAAFNTLVYIGLHYTTSINASLMNSSTPIIIYILSFIFLKERLSKFQLIGTILSLSGVVFIITGGSFASLVGFTFNKGDVIVTIAVCCWSVYSLLIKQYAKRLPGQSTFLVTIVLGLVLLFPFYLYETLEGTATIHWGWSTIAAILYVGVFASIVAFLCWNNGVIQLGANKASIYLNFIPVFATIFAILFLHEKLHAFQIIGGLAVVAGVILAGKTNKQRLPS